MKGKHGNIKNHFNSFVFSISKGLWKDAENLIFRRFSKIFSAAMELVKTRLLFLFEEYFRKVFPFSQLHFLISSVMKKLWKILEENQNWWNFEVNGRIFLPKLLMFLTELETSKKTVIWFGFRFTCGVCNSTVYRFSLLNFLA